MYCPVLTFFHVVLETLKTFTTVFCRIHNDYFCDLKKTYYLELQNEIKSVIITFDY